MKSLIKLENINYSYGKINALNNINLSFFEGENVAIIGSNGSGKSTLGKIIISLLKPKSGNLYFQGTLIDGKNDNLIRNKTGIVFQNPDNQFIGITVADDIAFGLENRQIPHDKMQGIINDYAKKVGVYDILNKQPQNLSGGQKQRVAIAGVLALNPNIIIFDEATSMLDPKGQTDIKQLIRNIRQDNPKLLTISITHDIDDIYLYDRVIVLSKGNIEFDGDVEMFFSSLENLKNIGVEEPFIYKLNNELKKEGLISKSIYNFKDLINMLCK